MEFFSFLSFWNTQNIITVINSEFSMSSVKLQEKSNQ